MAEILHYLGCIKPCKWWDKLPTSTGAAFQPSTAVLSVVHWLQNFDLFEVVMWLEIVTDIFLQNAGEKW